MKRSNSLRYNFFLLFGDFTALLLAFVGAYVIRVRWDNRSLIETVQASEYALIIAALLVVWLFIFALLGLYKSTIYENRFREFLLLLVGSMIGIQFLITAEYVLNRPVFPARLVVVYGLGLSFLLTLLSRTIVRIVFRWQYERGRNLTNVLIIGNSKITEELTHALSNPTNGYRLIGVVGDRRFNYGHIAKDRQFSSFSDAIAKLKDPLHAIVQTELYADDNSNQHILSHAQKNHIGYRFIPGNELFVGSLEVELFQNIPTISVHQTALTGWGRIFKRVFDITFGALLTILALPLLAAIWLLIKLFGGGDPIFKQTRLTRFNNTIRLYKFRSMKQEYSGMSPEEGFRKMGKSELIKQYRQNGDKLENDPRITRIGRFLRKTSLDELPQLFNVLRGDLSLVGPRPLVPEEMDQYSDKNVILSVKPGITGLAVVSGRKNISFDQRRRLDMYYAQNWSFWLDIVIIAKTAASVINRVFSNEVD